MTAGMFENNGTVGVVLEGGGMRGLYTAGVLDVWMENGITATATVGVSAGAVFGCNFKSHQIGRVLRYNLRFCNDPRYASLRNLVTTGDLYTRDFAYRELPHELDIFDVDTFAADPMRFTVVCTDLETGEPVYQDLTTGDDEELDWMRASASVPLLARPVELDGHKLLDGGIADPIPVRWMLGQGYDKLVVVLTQPADYRKQPNRYMPLMRKVLHDYPAFVQEVGDRHVRYNTTLGEIALLERAGKALVIRPSESVKAPVATKDSEELERIYQVGRADAEAWLPALKAYLAADPVERADPEDEER